MILLMARLHRETKKRSNLKFVTNGQTDRQSQLLTIMTPRLGEKMNKWVRLVRINFST